jgi:hypothetical protein
VQLFFGNKDVSPSTSHPIAPPYRTFKHWPMRVLLSLSMAFLFSPVPAQEFHLLDRCAAETSPSYRLLDPSPRPKYDPFLLPAAPVAFRSPWDYRSLGVFCKVDVKLARFLPIPLLIRLDDVQRVEAMEGKGAFVHSH